MHCGSRCLRLSPHPHVHGHLCVLFTLILPFYFLLYLPPLLFSLLYLKVCGKPAQLRQREYGLHRRVHRTAHFQISLAERDISLARLRKSVPNLSDADLCVEQQDTSIRIGVLSQSTLT